MADISKIKLPDGTEYDIKDTVARQSSSGGVDYITEQGTKSGNHGTWFYRKWNSGMVEAWYNMDTSISVNFNSSSSVAGTYRKDSTTTIPSGIFSSKPNFGMVNVQQDSTTIHGEFHPVSATSGTVYWTRDATGTANITAHIYLMYFPT